MAHHRKLIGGAVALNAAIVLAEVWTGFVANSLSLIMDGLHNLSDELALVFLYLAYAASSGVSRTMLRTANVLNSLGLIAMSALLLYHAAARILDPQPVIGWLPMTVGLAAAGANWGVARLLARPARDNAAVRLAYVHNLGDAWVSLAPAAAGLLVTVSGQPLFDPAAALLIGSWILLATLRETLRSSEELIWPEKIVCGHETGRRS